MLEIPEHVEELLHKTSVRKNFRIHFPNGEREDITNHNLVSESVTLTESLCSEANLKFGLCEASTLEFTTINVGNIKGCVIKAQLEVDLSLLDAAEIAEFAAYPRDLDYPVYPIPYGVFTIDSCRRQNDMAQRDVVAYSEVYHAESGLSPIEQAKQQFGIKTNVPYTIGTWEFLASNIKNLDVAGYGGSEKHPPWMVSLDSRTVITKDDSGSGWEFEYRVKYFRIELSDEVTNDDLYRNVYCAKFIVRQAAFEEYDRIYREDAGFDLDERYFYPVQIWLGTKDKAGYDRKMRVQVDGAYAIYPDIGYYEDYVFDIEFATEVWARYEGTVAYHAKLLDEYSLTAYTSDNSTLLQFPRKKNGAQYLIDTEIHYAEIINAYLELHGLFGRSSRNGKYQFVALGNLDGLLPSDDLYPADDLYPDDGWDVQTEKSYYYNLWWDEYVIQPYGRVAVTYKNTEGELVEYSLQFEPENPNIYYVKDNFILKNGAYTEEEIKELLTTSLIPNLPSAGYVPMELECIGMPHMEAGDRISVELAGDSLKTYIMQRTLTGIQALTDAIDVTGDEINGGGQ